MSETSSTPNRHATPTPGLPGTEIFGPARVLEVEEAGARIQVMLAAAGTEGDPPSAPRSVWAERAMPFDQELGWGDCVLVAGREPEDLYVIGVLGAPKAKAKPAREIELSNGVRADSPDGESLSVYAPDGRVLFRHEGSSGRSRIDLPSGDVEFVAHSGSIDFVAAEKIRFTSRDAIELSSLGGIRVAAHDALRRATSLLSLDAKRLSLDSEALDLRARKGRLAIEEASYHGQRLRVTLDQIKSVVKRSETLAETIIEKAKNTYRSVDSLSQVVAGRVRTIVDGAYQLRSKHAFLKSDEDFKIDGEKIHLG